MNDEHQWERMDDDGYNMICTQCHQCISYHNPEEWTKYSISKCEGKRK